jgi:hypothetical protein
MKEVTLVTSTDIVAGEIVIVVGAAAIAIKTILNINTKKAIPFIVIFFTMFFP